MNTSIKPTHVASAAEPALDATDLALLAQLQTDASLTNQALAERLGVSPATALRRTKLLRDAGLIERTVALLSPDKIATALGAGLTAIVEVTLDVQTAESATQFEVKCEQDSAVQQLYRVSSGPDFVLICGLRDMPDYQAMLARLFTADANVRNVKTFFSIKRAKFAPSVVLG
jgi:Lrp/AsnC family transcriptional regulator, leucine-responsive regulatory protein